MTFFVMGCPMYAIATSTDPQEDGMYSQYIIPGCDDRWWESGDVPPSLSSVTVTSTFDWSKSGGVDIVKEDIIPEEGEDKVRMRTEKKRLKEKDREK